MLCTIKKKEKKRPAASSTTLDVYDGAHTRCRYGEKCLHFTLAHTHALTQNIQKPTRIIVCVLQLSDGRVYGV